MDRNVVVWPKSAVWVIDCRFSGRAKINLRQYDSLTPSRDLAAVDI
jgi:hypothetical protein